MTCRIKLIIICFFLFNFLNILYSQIYPYILYPENKDINKIVIYKNNNLIREYNYQKLNDNEINIILYSSYMDGKATKNKLSDKYIFENNKLISISYYKDKVERKIEKYYDGNHKIIKQVIFEYDPYGDVVKLENKIIQEYFYEKDNLVKIKFTGNKSIDYIEYMYENNKIKEEKYYYKGGEIEVSPYLYNDNKSYAILNPQFLLERYYKQIHEERIEGEYKVIEERIYWNKEVKENEYNVKSIVKWQGDRVVEIQIVYPIYGGGEDIEKHVYIYNDD